MTIGVFVSRVVVIVEDPETAATAWLRRLGAGLREGQVTKEKK